MVAWRSLGLLVALLYLFLSLASADHALHECWHADAGQAGHQCVLTLISHGQVDFDPPAVAPIIRCEWVNAPLLPTEILPAPAGHRLPPGRGPPTV